MTESGWYEARGLVAVAAIIVGGSVVRRWRFTPGGDTIVASCAAIHDAGVIITGTDEGRGVMT